MTIPKSKLKSSGRPLVPDQIYRPSAWPDYFGLGPTQISQKIKAGELPRPVRLSPSGKATGLFGWQILEHHQKLAEQLKKDD
jgi:predicted DNA-binding transcriptional regulator AlpA